MAAPSAAQGTREVDFSSGYELVSRVPPRQGTRGEQHAALVEQSLRRWPQQLIRATCLPYSVGHSSQSGETRSEPRIYIGRGLVEQHNTSSGRYT